jgi:hypothetical protein
MRKGTADQVAFLEGWYCNKKSKRFASIASSADIEGLTPAAELPYVRDSRICRGIAGHDAWTKGKFTARAKKLTAAYEAKKARDKRKEEQCRKSCQRQIVRCDSAETYFCDMRYGEGRCSTSDNRCRCCTPSTRDCSINRATYDGSLSVGVNRIVHNLSNPSCRLGTWD